MVRKHKAHMSASISGMYSGKQTWVLFLTALWWEAHSASAPSEAT